MLRIHFTENDEVIRREEVRKSRSLAREVDGSPLTTREGRLDRVAQTFHVKHKEVGERGYPCLIPMTDLNLSVLTSFHMTCIEELVIVETMTF